VEEGKIGQDVEGDGVDDEKGPRGHREAAGLVGRRRRRDDGASVFLVVGVAGRRRRRRRRGPFLEVEGPLLLLKFLVEVEGGGLELVAEGGDEVRAVLELMFESARAVLELIFSSARAGLGLFEALRVVGNEGRFVVALRSGGLSRRSLRSFRSFRSRARVGRGLLGVPESAGRVVEPRAKFLDFRLPCLSRVLEGLLQRQGRPLRVSVVVPGDLELLVQRLERPELPRLPRGPLTVEVR